MKVRDKKAGVVIFDGTCFLCSYAVSFIIKRDPKGIFFFIPSQNNLADQLAIRYSIKESFDDTFVLIQESKCYFKSNAVLEIAAQLSGPWRFLKILRLIPLGVRDALYDLVAAHRYYWFGRSEVCMLPRDDVARRFIT